jgi:hypothetical protein
MALDSEQKTDAAARKAAGPTIQTKPSPAIVGPFGPRI